VQQLVEWMQMMVPVRPNSAKLRFELSRRVQGRQLRTIPS
jgi:hypothetical protein